MSKIPLLIDTDPGVDDALAILMAINEPSVQVVGLTVAAGNVGLQHTVANALKLVEVGNAPQVPVFKGCDAPLVHPSPDAADVHGADGFGDVNYPKANGTVHDEHAVQAILRLSHEHTGQLLLVALGPLTNIAAALKIDPTLPQRIARFVVMGGAVTAHGNLTPAAEFNIAFDPEAAKVVFDTFPMTELVDWEATIAHGLPHDQIETWLEQDSEAARFYELISRRTRNWAKSLRGFGDWHSADSLAMTVALEPTAALRTERRPLMVETRGEWTRGATVIDWNRQTGRADNVQIALEVDTRAYFGRVKRALGG